MIRTLPIVRQYSSCLHQLSSRSLIEYLHRSSIYCGASSFVRHHHLSMSTKQKEADDPLAFVKKSGKKYTLFDHALQPGIVNLKMGAPGEVLLKKSKEIMKKATAHKLMEEEAHLLFQYGPEVGDRKFLETLAKFLTEEYKSPVDVDDLYTTAGATQGLHILCHLLFSEGDLVFVEDPTYFLAMRIFEDAGLKFRGVPMDDKGIIPEELEKVLEANKNHKPRELTERKPYWSLLYVISTFHNPRGMCLPPDRCEKLVEIARKYNLLVVSDDVYNMLYFGDSPPTRLFQFDKKSDDGYQGNVVSNGTFSKMFGPGVRLGWMEMPERVMNSVLSTGLAPSGGGFNHCMSGIMESVISLGLLTELLKEARVHYRESCKALCDVFKAQLPTVSLTEPTGGYFLWMKLPEGLSGTQLMKTCEENFKVTFAPGVVTSPSKQFDDCVRLSFCHYDKDVLAQAAEKIVKAIKMLQSQK